MYEPIRNRESVLSFCSIAISRIRELTGTGQFGTNLLGLKRGAEALGFHSRALKVSPTNIDQKLQFLPALLHESSDRQKLPDGS